MEARVPASGLSPFVVHRSSAGTETEKRATPPVVENPAIQNSSGDSLRNDLFSRYTSVLIFRCPHPYACGAGCPGQSPDGARLGAKNESAVGCRAQLFPVNPGGRRIFGPLPTPSSFQCVSYLSPTLRQPRYKAAKSRRPFPREKSKHVWCDETAARSALALPLSANFQTPRSSLRWELQLMSYNGRKGVASSKQPWRFTDEGGV